MSYKSKNHSKFLLQFHLIFVCKYRKQLLQNINIDNKIKELSYKIALKHKVIIKKMESDKDHIHYMLETEPNINLCQFVKILKSYTTFHIWQYFYQTLSRYFWKEKTFWTDGYFISSIGNVSEKALEKYIENQG